MKAPSHQISGEAAVMVRRMTAFEIYYILQNEANENVKEDNKKRHALTSRTHIYIYITERRIRRFSITVARLQSIRCRCRSMTASMRSSQWRYKYKKTHNRHVEHQENEVNQTDSRRFPRIIRRVSLK